MTRECDHADEAVAEIMSLVDHEFAGAEVEALNQYMRALVVEPLTDDEEFSLCVVRGDGQGFTNPTFELNHVGRVADALRKRCPQTRSPEQDQLANDLRSVRRLRRVIFRDADTSLDRLVLRLMSERDEWRQKATAKPAPVPMLLVCPACGERHIDVGDFATRPHHTHACQTCGTCWRPAVADTVGVQFLPGFKDEVTP